MTLSFVIPEFNIGGAGTPLLQFYRRGFNLGGSGSQPSWRDIILSGNTALTLVNAKANGLNYVKLFGGIEQRSLPSEYTQLKYIQSDGESYLIVPYRVNNKTVFYCRYNEVQNGPQAANAIFGVTNAPSVNVANYGILRLTGGLSSFNRMGWGDNTSGSTIDVNAPKAFDTWYEVLYDQNKLYQDGTLYATSATDPSTVWSANYDLGVFARNSSSVTMPAVAKISSVWAKEDGEYKINLVPAKRNSDNVLGMYDLVSGQFFTNAGTGGFIAGADAVPTPNNPMDIISNNGVMKYSINEANYTPENVVLGYWIRNNNGQPEASPANFYTNLMPVKPNTSYVCYGRSKTDNTISGYNRIAWYDANGTWLRNSTYTQGTIGQDVSPSDGAFARFHCNINGVEVTQELVNSYNWTFCEGSVEVPYVPYSPNGIYTDGTVETIWIHSKNLFDKNSENILPGWYDESNQVVGQPLGVLSSSSNYHTSAPIFVSPGATYTVVGTGGSTPSFVYLDSNMCFVSGFRNGGAGITSRTFTVPNDPAIKYLRFPFSTSEVDSCQLELGSTATAYESYRILGTATAEMLLKVGDYQDIQSVLDGEVTRNVGIKVLDGSENWSIQPGYTSIFVSADDNINGIPTKDTPCVCTHYKGIEPKTSVLNVQNNEVKCGYNNSSNKDKLYVRDDRFTTVKDFNQFLASQYANGTPVIVVYPLDEPTTETVTAQPLSIQAGTNIVEIAQASIDNLELEVSYKAGVAVTVEEIEAVNNDESVEVIING